jgi:hypothetical protein
MTTETLDRRSAIESAFEAAEKVETPEAVIGQATEPAPTEQNEKAPEPSPTEIADKPVEKPTEPVVATETAEKTEKPLPVDKAPQSWRGPQKAKWESLDPDVRQEVMRREREVTRVLGESSQARHFSQQFQQTLQPFSDYIQSRGVQPLQAFTHLLEADRLLSTAPADQRANYMAKLINDYKIDLVQLDSALAGKGAPDPTSSRLESLLDQRLAPINQFLTQQQQQILAKQQQDQQAVLSNIEKMASDPKFEHFADVREDMADIIDLQAKKGVYLTLEQAYTRAIAMNPDISQVEATSRMNAAKTEAARAANAKAQLAKAASKSVGGAPNGLSSGASGKLDRRAAIEAAFSAAEGR